MAGYWAAARVEDHRARRWLRFGGRIRWTRLYEGVVGSRQAVMAFDEATGEKLWETNNGGQYRNRRGSGPRGPPTVDAGTVYALGSNDALIALDAAQGTKLWSTNPL